MAGVGVQYPSYLQRENFKFLLAKSNKQNSKKPMEKKTTILKQSVVKKILENIKKNNKLQTKCCKKKFKTYLKPNKLSRKIQNSNKLQPKCCQKILKRR